jgi:hypothetical protein
VNDGLYGNDHAWSDGWFEYKLRGRQTIGRFKFGRDRTGLFSDRLADYIKIETSLDEETWQTVFEFDNLTKLPGFSASKTVEVQITPVIAQYLKVTLAPPDMPEGPFPCIDEFEAYAPAAQAPAKLPQVKMLDAPEVWNPTRGTTLTVESLPTRIVDSQEVLELRLNNTGPMTALFCEPHPLIAYRTDLFIENNHCFIPPGESRVITIRAGVSPRDGLSLGQTGWRVSSWNADDQTVTPTNDVLLAVGRRDKMCREFLGYFEPGKDVQVNQTTLAGTFPDAFKLPYRLKRGDLARFEFSINRPSPQGASRLRIHTADQSKDVVLQLLATVNGKPFSQLLPTGLGIQATDPQHMAFPATAEFLIPPDALHAGKNIVEIEVKNEGWFTWDALDFTETHSLPISHQSKGNSR